MFAGSNILVMVLVHFIYFLGGLFARLNAFLQNNLHIFVQISAILDRQDRHFSMPE